MIDWEEVKVRDVILMKKSSFSFDRTIYEVQIMDFSPSRRYAKVRYLPTNRGEWIDTREYLVLEKLTR